MIKPCKILFLYDLWFNRRMTATKITIKIKVKQLFDVRLSGGQKSSFLKFSYKHVWINL